MKQLNGHDTSTTVTPQGFTVTLEHVGPVTVVHYAQKRICATASQKNALDIADVYLQHCAPGFCGFPASDGTPDPSGFQNFHKHRVVRIKRPKSRETGALGVIQAADPASGTIYVKLDRLASPQHGFYTPAELDLIHVGGG